MSWRTSILNCGSEWPLIYLWAVGNRLFEEFRLSWFSNLQIFPRHFGYWTASKVFLFSLIWQNLNKRRNILVHNWRVLLWDLKLFNRPLHFVHFSVQFPLSHDQRVLRLQIIIEKSDGSLFFWDLFYFGNRCVFLWAFVLVELLVLITLSYLKQLCLLLKGK